MIALFGALANPSIAYLCRRLVETGAEPRLFDARQFPSLFDPRWSLRDGRLQGEVRHGDGSTPIETIGAVYVHQIEHALRGPSAVSWERRRSAGHEAMAAFLGVLPCLVVNRPDTCRSNRSKPLQQHLIASHGFRVPRTLVTTSPESALRFWEEQHGRVVMKPLGAQRARLTRVTASDLARINDLHGCPTMFQEIVAGSDIRVHVVGDEVFATRIEGGALDYRYPDPAEGSASMRTATLDPLLTERCRSLARGLGMAVSGIDLRETPGGEHLCFEVNPAPGFVYYQTLTGQPIGEAVLRLLLAADADKTIPLERQ